MRACRREPVERTPVWFMRQAGRSLPEYREVASSTPLRGLPPPELCAEVTLQPVRAHGVDAAVMFADIMLPVLGMGIDVELVESVGPVIAEPVRTMADVERLRRPRSARVRSRSSSRRCGSCARSSSRSALWSVSAAGRSRSPGYLVEGKPTRDFVKVKTLMYREPAVWHALMEKLTETSARTCGRRSRRARM